MGLGREGDKISGRCSLCKLAQKILGSSASVRKGLSGVISDVPPPTSSLNRRANHQSLDASTEFDIFKWPLIGKNGYENVIYTKGITVSRRERSGSKKCLSVEVASW